MLEDRWFLEPLLGIGFTFGLAFAFVSYTPRATTFQVKLVGLTLTAVLLVLASAVVITAETAEAKSQGVPPPPARLSGSHLPNAAAMRCAQPPSGTTRHVGRTWTSTETAPERSRSHSASPLEARRGTPFTPTPTAS